MKKILSLLLAFSLALSLAACGGSASSAVSSAAVSEAASSAAASEEEAAAPLSATEPLRIAGLKGPTTMGLVNLMSDEVASNYNFTMYGAADEIVPLLVKGDLDAAAVPANLAATLYNKTNGAVEVACINTLGVLYIVENGETVNSVGDLKGQTIVTTGKGATPEYVLRYVLTENGVDPDSDVTIEYCSEATEALSKVQAGEATIAMLPQPFVTTAQTKSENIRVALDLTEEWDEIQAESDAPSTLVTGVVVGRTEFVAEHPEAVSAFLEHYRASVEYVNANVDEAAQLVGQYEIVAAEVAQKALPECNIVFIEGVEMKDSLSGYLSVLFEQNPKSVGGALPDDAFYYSR